MVTSAASLLNSYMMYTGDDSIYTYTFEHQKNPSCLVCSTAPPIKVHVTASTTVQEFIEILMERPDMFVTNLFLVISFVTLDNS